MIIHCIAFTTIKSDCCCAHLRGTSSRPLVDEADFTSTTIVQNIYQHRTFDLSCMHGLSQTWHHLQTFRLLVWSVSGVHQQRPVDESAHPVCHQLPHFHRETPATM